ncbi:2Fe-2S iron-sulfur cluster-binding protein [Salinarimonas rosea]|uniref:2Fe-2S iron-sulfur cluster-binding protein n=1 Tax=Salinarimonas rosea TaxID=552063 RepID=UPI000693FB3C|nr:2Fe-2S iron-sulfur cluster-binding protein [Salinarimonas rosea]
MHELHLLQEGRSIPVPAGTTILDAALEAGVAFPHGCRSGRCGSCKARVTGAGVTLLDHSRFALTAEEKAAGLILACRAVPEGDVSVVWLGDEDAGGGHPVRTVSARVAAADPLTHDIRGLRLSIPGAPLAFSAGQYARLAVPGTPPRDYSMANRPGDRELEFHVRRVPGGATSEAIHDRLAVGDEVVLTGPFGSSHLRIGHPGPILAVAGGSGLAPIRSIVETALSLGMRQDIHVYFGARTDRDLYDIGRFEALAARHPNLSFTPVLSGASSRAYRTGLVADAVAADHRDLTGWKAYLAGPPAMVEAMLQVAARASLGIGDIHADVFFTPDARPVASAAPAERGAPA